MANQCTDVIKAPAKSPIPSNASPNPHSLSNTLPMLPTPMMKPTLDEWLNPDPEDIIKIGPKHWNPTHHHDDMMENSPGVLNAFNIDVTECQPHFEPVLDTMANVLVDANNLSDMQAWHDHRVISHEDGTFCTDMWDINPFGTINTDGTFFTDAWDKDPTWMAENFQVKLPINNADNEDDIPPLQQQTAHATLNKEEVPNDEMDDFLEDMT